MHGSRMTDGSFRIGLLSHVGTCASCDTGEMQMAGTCTRDQRPRDGDVQLYTVNGKKKSLTVNFTAENELTAIHGLFKKSHSNYNDSKHIKTDKD